MTPRAFLRLVETDVAPSFFITGNHPTREVDPADCGGEPMWVVHFPRGFETLDVAVIGHGLCGADVIDAAMGFLNAEHPESLTAEERDAAFPDEHGIAVTPPSRSKKAWEPTPAQTAANDDEMRANGSFQEGRRKPVAERNGDIHRMSFARSEAVTEAAKSLRVQCGNGNTVDGWYDRISRNWVVQVKDSEETQIGDAEYSGSRGSFENSMQCLIDQNGGRSEHIPNRTGHMAESESSQELSYEETLYRGDEQAEVKVVITATYYGAEAGMPQSYASGGSPPDAARVDFDSIRAFKVDGSHEKVELDDDERAAAEARLSTMAEGGFADDLGADDRD